MFSDFIGNKNKYTNGYKICICSTNIKLYALMYIKYVMKMSYLFSTNVLAICLFVKQCNF